MEDERTARMIEMRDAGKTLAEISEEFDLSRERVRQLLKANGVRTMQHADHMQRAIDAWRTSGELRHPSDVAREHGITVNGKNVAGLRRACPDLALPESKPGGSRWDAPTIAKILQRIAAEQDIDPATGWIKIAEYDAWHSAGDPSAATVGANYLWSDLMRLAGFDPKHASRRGRRPGAQYRAFTDDDLDDAVLAYVDSRPDRVTSIGLEAFLESRPDLPSMATIRNRFRKRGIASIADIITDVVHRRIVA